MGTSETCARNDNVEVFATRGKASEATRWTLLVFLMAHDAIEEDMAY